MSIWTKVFKRNSGKKTVDPGQQSNDLYNEAAGATKVMIIEPDIKSAYVASTAIGAGKLIKITGGGVYSLEFVGKVFSAATRYSRGNIVVQAGRVYICDIPEGVVSVGAFDTEDWSDVAAAVIAGIPNAAGDVVSTGRWHNAISVAGFVVEDDSEIKLIKA